MQYLLFTNVAQKERVKCWNKGDSKTSKACFKTQIAFALVHLRYTNILFGGREATIGNTSAVRRLTPTPLTKIRRTLSPRGFSIPSPNKMNGFLHNTKKRSRPPCRKMRVSCPTKSVQRDAKRTEKTCTSRGAILSLSAGNAWYVQTTH